MEKEKFSAVLWNRTKEIAGKTGKALGFFFLKNSLGQCLLLGAVMVIILEILGLRSFTGGLLYPVTHPMAFVINTLLVAMTFAISIPFKRRYFGYMLAFILWLAMGVTNFVLLGMRVTPLKRLTFTSSPPVFPSLPFICRCLRSFWWAHPLPSVLLR